MWRERGSGSWGMGELEARGGGRVGCVTEHWACAAKCYGGQVCGACRAGIFGGVQLGRAWGRMLFGGSGEWGLALCSRCVDA